ncbi:unnamed protein product [Dracunculus medinensis]|uniref:ATP-binding cassette sub-family F member 3 n=1 Tax=Dracunculus medinensis TaxID=318479 RepID=A0A0N4UF30_DRAME|nr:unnamed protein product [Dracunculus medinensis]
MSVDRLVDEYTAEIFTSDASYYFLLIPNLIPAILYENVDDMNCKEDVMEAVGDHLKCSIDGVTDEEINNICEKLILLLQDCRPNNSSKVHDGYRRLEKVVDISTQAIDSEDFESIWKVTTRETPTVLLLIDKRKLGRAQAKALEKASKRELDGHSSKKKSFMLAATASQTPSRRDISSANIMDIHLNNVDINIGAKQLLKGTDVVLSYGRRYGLVGRNGAGKSTFLRMISSGQLVIPANIRMLSVEQEVEGDDTEVLQAVLKSDIHRLKLLNREKELQENLLRSDVNENDRKKFTAELMNLYSEMQIAQLDKAVSRAASILFGLGFTPDEQKRSTKEFSGGWRMRIALACALFIQPDLLLLDEPTNMLDMRAIFWLENYLQDWASTVVIVSHDRSFLNSVCTDIIHLHSKMLHQYRGNYAIFEKSVKDKLTQQQREYEAQQQLRQHTQEFIDKFRYNAKRASMVQSRIKMLERLPILKPVEIETEVTLRFPDCEVLSNPVLQLDEVSFRYTPLSPLIFQNICIGSHANSRICIVGENGSGKTTLLKLLLGEINPVSGFRNANRRLKIGYFTQHHVDQLDMDVSVIEVLMNRYPGKTQEDYRSALGRFGLSGELALQPVVTLSGGQKSRLAFANIAMMNPNYLVMDEPTNHLDVETVEALGKALKLFKGGVLIVSHDERLIEIVCNELWVVKDRTVIHLEGGLEEYKRHVHSQLALLA